MESKIKKQIQALKEANVNHKMTIVSLFEERKQYKDDKENLNLIDSRIKFYSNLVTQNMIMIHNLENQQ
jgi:CTP:phosphocholine cytidylyltransferase-like protein